jgi:hypothetical protein
MGGGTAVVVTSLHVNDTVITRQVTMAEVLDVNGAAKFYAIGR